MKYLIHPSSIDNKEIRPAEGILRRLFPIQVATDYIIEAITLQININIKLSNSNPVLSQNIMIDELRKSIRKSTNTTKKLSKKPFIFWVKNSAFLRSRLNNPYLLSLLLM